MIMLQHYRPEAYFRPGVTTVSVVAPENYDSDKYRSKTCRASDNRQSTSELGAGSRPGLGLLGLSWIWSSRRGEPLPACLSDCDWPYNGYASGPTPAPDSDYGMEGE